MSDQHTTMEKAPSLKNWGSLAHRVAKLARLHPQLGMRLLCAPPEAMHSLAAFLQTHGEEDDITNAQVVFDTAPKKLLPLSFDEPAKLLFSCLKKCEPIAHTMAFYNTINGILKSDAGTELMRCTKIDIPVLRFFTLARRREFDPLVIAAHLLLKHKIDHATAMHDLLQTLRALGVLGDNETECKALRRAKKSIFHYVDARLNRTVSPLVLNLPRPLIHVNRGKDLTRLALEFGNCLRALTYRVWLGSDSHIIVHLDEPCAEHHQGAIAVLVLGAGGRFWVTECQHANNRECDRRVRERIVELLEDAGVSAGVRHFAAAMEPFLNAPDIPEYAYR